MTQERSFIFGCFGVGILATLGCLLSAAHVLMEPEVAAVASCLILSTVYLVISEARRIQKRFFLEEDEIVSFEELRNIYPEIAPLAKGGAQSTYSGVGTPTRTRSSSGQLRAILTSEAYSGKRRRSETPDARYSTTSAKVQGPREKILLHIF